MPKNHRFTASLAALLMTACSSPDSPENQVTQVIGRMEGAAEARDVGDFMESIATDFRGRSGEGPDELRRYVQGYFIANQSIRLLTRIDSIEFPHPDEARVRVTVGMAGREAGAADAWNLATDIQTFEAVLRPEGGEWKVIYAGRAGSGNSG